MAPSATATSSETAEPVLLHWRMARNCALTPGAAMASLGGLGLVCLLIGGFFWLLGAPWVLAFAGLDALALVLAFWAYARHAGDHETLVLRHAADGPRLQVLRQRAGRSSSVELPVSQWFFSPVPSTHALVELRAAGQCLQLGRFLRPDSRLEFRRALAWQLQQAARLCPTPPLPQGCPRPAGTEPN